MLAQLMNASLASANPLTNLAVLLAQDAVIHGRANTLPFISAYVMVRALTNMENARTSCSGAIT